MVCTGAINQGVWGLSRFPVPALGAARTHLLAFPDSMAVPVRLISADAQGCFVV